MTNLKGRTISSGLVTLLSQATQFVLTLGSTMVLARLLSPQDFGLVAMVATIMGFLRVFKDAGLSTATVQREGITHAQVSNLFWINVALTAAITLLVAASAPLIAWFYGDSRLVGISLVLSVTFLLTGSTVQHLALLNRQMRFKMIAFIQISSLLAGIVVGILMAWRNFGYWSLVGMQLTTPFVSLLLTWWASPWRPQMPARGSGTRSLLKFGADLTLSSFLWSLARGSDTVLIGRFYGADAAGLYTRAAALLNRPLDQFLSPFNAVFVPVLSRVQSEPERYRRTFLRVFEALALISFFFTGFFLALSRPLTLFVLGPEWGSACVIFAAFTLTALFYPLSSAASCLLASQGRGRDWLRVSTLASGTTVIAFVLGMPFGPAGVAMAYSSSSVLILLPIMFARAGDSGPVKTRDLWAGFIRHLPVCGVVGFVTFMTLSLLSGLPPWQQLLVCVPVGSLFGAGFVWCYGPSRRAALSLVDALREWKKR